MRQYYKPHRGRSRLNTFLRILLFVLIVVLLLAVAAFLYLRRYMVYGADGSAHLELPFLPKESVSPSPAVQSPVVVIEPSPSATPAVSPGKPTYAKLYKPSAVTADVMDTLAGAGENTVVLDVKPANGTLAYDSDAPLAPASSSGEKTDLGALVSQLKEKGLYCAARISCFRDTALSKSDRSLALKTSGGSRWLDGGQVGWTNPYDSDVRDYLISLAAELAKLGFDEILLDNCGFPTTGKTGLIDYGSDEDTPHSQVVEDFIKQMRSALAPYDVILSVVTDKTTLEDGENEDSGQTKDLLLTDADRIYISHTASQRDDLEQAIGGNLNGEDVKWKLVSILKATPSEKSYSFMVAK